MKNKKHYLHHLVLTALICSWSLYAMGQYTIPVSVHIARTSSGTSPRATTTQVNAEIASLNSAYGYLGITFVKCSQDFIDEDRLWDQFDDGDQTEKDWLDNFTDPNVVNYFITDLEGGGHGKAVFPYKQKDWLAVDYDEMGTSTVAHEMGHYLNLHHTYSGVDGDDPASSGSLTIDEAEGSNGWKYGDYLIDTPLDPEERDDFNSSCSYTGNQKDANGDSFHPDGRNFMGKGHNYCRDRFSQGQEDRILRAVNVDRYYLDCNDSGNTNLTCANSSSVSNFPHNDSFNGGYDNSPWVQARYGDELNWQIGPNTDSDNTGPNGAQNGQTFMHAEASFTYTSSDELSLLSPCYDLKDKTSAEVEFYYHMYGSGTGSLKLEVSTNNGSSWSSLFSKSGEQHSSGSSSWTQQVVNLDSYAGQSIQLRLRATLGTSSKGDIAIDNVTVDASSSGGGGGSTVVLSESYFESGWDDWNDLNTSSTDCERKTNTSFAAEGNDAIRIKDDLGDDSTMESDAFDVSGYDDLEFEFKVIGDDHESSSETFSVLYYDGSSWHNEATYSFNSDYFDGSAQTITLNISSDNRTFPSNAKFRIESDGSSSNGDYTYIDAVIISGSTNSQARTKVSTVATEDRNMELDVAEVSLFPNPVSSIMKIESKERIISAQVYDINGATHNKISFNSVESTLDVSDLSNGVYIMLITTDQGGIHTRKFIKQ